MCVLLVTCVQFGISPSAAVGGAALLGGECPQGKAFTIAGCRVGLRRRHLLPLGLVSLIAA